ncbi:hypothetical protein D3C87_1444080 [compost metagenome]
MAIRQSYTIAHGGRYDLGPHIGKIGKVRIVSITVNGKLIRYSDLTYRESGTPSKHYVEIGRQFCPLVGGMVMVNKDAHVIETFISSDQFYDSVVVTLDIYEVGES